MALHGDFTVAPSGRDRVAPLRRGHGTRAALDEDMRRSLFLLTIVIIGFVVFVNKVRESRMEHAPIESAER